MKGETMERVSLQVYSTENKAQMQSYHLTKQQLKYTAHPIDALKKCKEDPSRYPLVILTGIIPAGFFVLHEKIGVRPYSKNPNAILLRAYSVQTAFQGKGIAKSSMELLTLFLAESFPTIDEVVLAVNSANGVAQQLYKKSGFHDTGRRINGKSGEQYIFSKLLNLKGGRDKSI
ncbi:ribosomal-protein-alanine acetyltransferase [Oceanobacillus picturae]|uniref:Ribosomal-protein-alanine acetyltransferase n=1 Tax=Oceanobacillus picturae TaxID=171693 RepID=W9AGD1_9BACI|nr:GNAT family N-acetyltransferase [Oceanobacillus picturae]CDO04533.1 ribosomal-protein-alanine acetyltransferase [Oceanobacillus picturae]